MQQALLLRALGPKEERFEGVFARLLSPGSRVNNEVSHNCRKRKARTHPGLSLSWLQRGREANYGQRFALSSHPAARAVCTAAVGVAAGWGIRIGC
jgi:hypothetical protein